MRNFFVLIVTVLLTLSSICIHAQEQPDRIIIDDRGLIINDNVIRFPVDYAQIVKIFGEPDRTLNKSANDVLTWDKMGIVGYRAKSSNNIKTISINFKPGDFDFSPKNIFKGEVIVNEHTLTVNTLKQDLYKYNFIVDPEDDTWWDFEIGNLYLIAVLSEDYSGLADLEIGAN